MFDEVKLGEADYYPGKGLLKPTAFSRLFAVAKYEKHSP